MLSLVTSEKYSPAKRKKKKEDTVTRKAQVTADQHRCIISLKFLSNISKQAWITTDHIREQSILTCKCWKSRASSKNPEHR